MSADNQAGPTLEAVRRARAQREEISRRIVPVVILAIIVLAVRSNPSPGWHGTSLGILFALAGLVAAAIGVALRSRPIQIHVLLLLLASSAALMWLQPGGPGAVGLLLSAGLAARLTPGRVGLIFAAVAAAFFLLFLLLGLSGPHTHRTGVSLAGVLILVSLLVTALFGRRIKQQEAQADQMLAELEHTRDAGMRAAALAERQRLAREMHDVLAHSLSGLMVQLEGARLLAVGDPADPRLGATIERAHHLARSGLEEARRAIGMLRGDELPGPDAIAVMASDFERDSGIPCRFTVAGRPRPLSSETMLAIYRVAQEALTNVRKHARPAQVELCLRYEPAAVRLTVEDMGLAGVPADVAAPAPAGIAASAGVPGSAGMAASAGVAALAGVPGSATWPAGGDSTGFGLTGMRERAELLGGTLTAGPAGAGFRVELRVPG